MIIEFNKSDKEPLSNFDSKDSTYRILREIDKNYKDTNLSDVTISNKFTMFGSNFKEIKEYTDTVKHITKCDIELINDNKYFFKIKVSGTLPDANGVYSDFISTFNLSTVFFSMKVDSNLEDSIRRGRGFNYSSNDSLILNFLSKRNGNEDSNTVYDIMRRNNHDNKFNNLISELFETLYGMSINDFNKLRQKKDNSNPNNMTLDAIDIKEMNSIREEVSELLEEES